MLFDPGTGPIRDLAWLDPTGELRAEWQRHLAWKLEHGVPARPRSVPNIAPITTVFADEGPVEHCSIPGFALLVHRIFTNTWEGCGTTKSFRGGEWESPDARAWAIKVRYARGMKTPYTDTFQVWDVPKPPEREDEPKEDHVARVARQTVEARDGIAS